MGGYGWPVIVNSGKQLGWKLHDLGQEPFKHPRKFQNFSAPGLLEGIVLVEGKVG